MTTAIISWRTILYTVAPVLLLVGVLGIGELLNKAYVVGQSTAAERALETGSNESEDSVSALPMRLLIPTLGVDAAVEYVGLTDDGTNEMDVPANFTDVGWYKHGVRPGMPGSAVIAGHVDGKDVPQAVFYDLHTLAVGDRVQVVNAEQIVETFSVVKIATYPYDAPTTDVFVSDDEKARLNLVTCSGDWLVEEDIYSTRTVVFTERVTER